MLRAHTKAFTDHSGCESSGPHRNLPGFPTYRHAEGFIYFIIIIGLTILSHSTATIKLSSLSSCWAYGTATLVQLECRNVFCVAQRESNTGFRAPPEDVPADLKVGSLAIVPPAPRYSIDVGGGQIVRLSDERSNDREVNSLPLEPDVIPHIFFWKRRERRGNHFADDNKS
ncbi:hypothetical protein PoB_004475200 [Plakobranchus ocellatus]|uniref:Uncharacterized protein n=1 Tax=Plakobranchus ocellatus TaxID=259542 RepID=A0AAV4BFQ5_9GAST|nr:hypothetical protein PoB_004475200 [Plakobranchus ocellatus]